MLGRQHYCEIFSISDDNKHSFYQKETINSGWSVREMKPQILLTKVEKIHGYQHLAGQQEPLA